MHALLKSSNETPITIERQLKLIKQVNPVLSHECRRRLRYMHMRSFDWEQGGLLSTVKFVDRDSVEYSLVVAADHELSEARMASLTLDNAMSLFDPIWGGVYQYSTQGKWDVPHYRKTMAAQAGHLRIYSLAYAQLKFDHYLKATNSILLYIKNFMTSEVGAFYAGQTDKVADIKPELFFSLDDSQRQKIGIPDVDKRIVTRENGWMIEALATHYEYCGSQQSLNMAIKATKWINQHCRRVTGAYLTNIMTSTPLHLSDTLAMARAMLQMYRATFDKRYLDYACISAEFMHKNFKNQLCGYNTRLINKNDTSPPRQIDENISITRFVNLLFHYSGNPLFKKMTKHGLRYCCIPEVATARMEEAGILLVDREVLAPPLTINISGNKNDPAVNEFINIAHRHEGWYKLIRLNPSATISASIEIDGYKSKPVTTPEKLKRLLQLH
ncbi:MAG: hypothetical protein HND53_11585 [Proteobacteria bacterium]|nr:hypothetical protein [Pseudomonadota bacterium]NOG61134.1 hypothetical protein [Pseudomonadota bacterium]